MFLEKAIWINVASVLKERSHSNTNSEAMFAFYNGNLTNHILSFHEKKKQCKCDNCIYSTFLNCDLEDILLLSIIRSLITKIKFSNV